MAAISNGSGDRLRATQRAGDGNVRKRFRIPGDKYCAVCGDKALAHHFAVLACESCKAFFRRNAFRQKDLKPCTGVNSCQMNKDNRRSCPSCRLTKCFGLGMKAELIYDEEQKKDLKEKVKRSKQERLVQQSSGPTEGGEHRSRSPVVSSTNIGVTAPELTTIPEAEGAHGNSPQKFADNSSPHNQFVVNPLTVDRSNEILQASLLQGFSEKLVMEAGVTKNSPHHVSANGFQNGMEDVSMADNNLTVACQPTGSLNHAQALWVEQVKPLVTDLSALTRAELPSDLHMYRRLSQEERTLLSQLTCVYEDTMLGYLRERRNTLKLDSSNYSLADSLSDYEAMVHSATDFTKRMEDFQRLSFDDRIACFKTSVDALIAVYNTYVYVAERNSWLMLKGEVSYDLFMAIFPSYPLMGWRTEQCRGLKSLAKNDVTIYSLLHCILLFNPGSDKISDRQLVSTMRDKYTILLRHYVEATFSYACSERYFKELQNRIVEIQDICQADRKHAEDTNCHLTDEFVPFELLLELHSEDK